MRRLPALLPQLLAASLALSTAQAQTTGYDPMRPSAPQEEGGEVVTNPDYGDLPDTPGMEETFYLCTACHSTAIIKQQRLSDARWDYLWTWMVEEQGMPEADAETKTIILDYLKRHFSSER